MSKKLYIKTWGCQMNVYDSKRMADALFPLGYEVSEEPHNADMIILNTCHIREKATDKVFSELGRLKEHKDNKESMILAVAGCVAQAEGDYIFERAPYVDMVFGPQNYHELPEMVAKATGAFGTNRIINTEFPLESKFDFLPEETTQQSASSFLSVQEGCDKFCTYCVVPYTRGSEFSRPVSSVLEEAKRLASLGTKEITLLGQNVNAYHGEAKDSSIWGLGRLIQEVAEIDGIERIRYTTSHPNDMDDELIAAHGNVEKLMPYLHLPVQHGSDKILKSMNRKHTADDYRRVIDKVRNVRPDIALSSDFIVGFPGEKDEDHEAMLQIIRDIGYSQCYSFKYSPRPGTPGANMGGVVAEPIKAARLQEVQELLNKQQIEFNQKFIGKILPVLFDRIGDKRKQLLGRTPYMQSIHIDGNKRLLNQTVDVKIEKAHANSVSGSIVTSETVLTNNNKEERTAA